MKLKTNEEADVNITSLIDCLMQCIIFFMVILSAEYIYGVAIKFAPPSQQQSKKEDGDKKEKTIIVEVGADQLERAGDGRHYVVADGVLKLNGKEIPLITDTDRDKWPEQRERAFNHLQDEMKRMVDKEGYKRDMLMIKGDVKTYHWKIMRVIDAGKADSIDAFSLVPPTN